MSLFKVVDVLLEVVVWDTYTDITSKNVDI